MKDLTGKIEMPRLSRIAVLLLLCAYPLSVAAVDDPVSFSEADRPEIVFSYTRQQTLKEDVAANIDVLTRKDMEKIPASNVAEALQYLPGVFIELTGGLRSQATATIQGSSVRQVAVYQDGVPLNLLANPMTDLSFLPLESVERIEVYKGAASSTWGSSLGGVINIITKEPNPARPFSGNVQTSYGQFDTWKNRGTVSGTADRLGYLLSVAHDQSQGFEEYSGFRQEAVYSKFNCYVGESSRLNFVYSYNEGTDKAPKTFYSPEFWQHGNKQRSYQRLLYDTVVSDGVAFSIEGRHQQFEGSVDEVFPTRTVNFFDYEEQTWGMSSRITWDVKDVNRFLFGLDGDWGTYEFSSFTRKYNSGNWAAYANDSFNLGDFTFTGGIRYDRNYDFGSEISPSAGAVYHLPWASALIKAQVARGFSAPPGAWVHDPVYGNEDLEAETGINYQVGAEAAPLKFLKVSLNLFRTEVDNLIRYNRATRKMENIDEAVRQGVEGRIGTKFDCGLALSFGGSFVDARDSATGEVIEDVPRVFLDTTASHTYKWLTQSLVGRFIDNNSSYPETHDEVFTFDYLARLRVPLRESGRAFSVFLAVYNLTDSGYLYNYGNPQPGRWFEGGVSFEF